MAILPVRPERGFSIVVHVCVALDVAVFAAIVSVAVVAEVAPLTQYPEG